eukprot:SAG11_NODE_3120_length_2672_cov_1.911776_3_plen_142_part_00
MRAKWHQAKAKATPPPPRPQTAVVKPVDRECGAGATRWHLSLQRVAGGGERWALRLTQGRRGETRRAAAATRTLWATKQPNESWGDFYGRQRDGDAAEQIRVAEAGGGVGSSYGEGAAPEAQTYLRRGPPKQLDLHSPTAE